MLLLTYINLAFFTIMMTTSVSASPKRKNRSNPTLNEGLEDFKACVEFKLKADKDVAKAFTACPFTPEGSGAAGKGNIIGGVPTSNLIVYAINLQLSSVRLCWEKELEKKAGQSAKAIMSFKIDASGSVQDLKITDLLQRYSVFEKCLQNAWSNFAFPTAVQDKTVTYPLNFSDK